MCSLRMVVLCVVGAFALTLLGPCPSVCAPQGGAEPDEQPYDLDDFDMNGETDWENLDLNGENYDYEDLDQEIEVGTVAPPAPETPPPANMPPPEYEEEMTLSPRPTPPLAPVTLDFKGPGLFGPDTGLDKLKSIDLTGNQISGVDEDAFRPLPQLQDILLADNNMQALPELPPTLRYIDVRNNRLVSNGLHTDGFKEMSLLEFLYLSDNKLDYIPVPLPESLRVLHLQNNNIQNLHVDTFCNSHDRNYIRRSLEDIRLDGNPVNINLYASSYICLPRLPIGSH
ncbi:opticin isoform X2 [Salmo trutta]|uniref:opticin isoform X2 n=1 Tax=Salmo trutta TaxID=8032 RepID=UPI00113295EE|nr:epiphycan-like isoform X2 [Salmo trutta]